MQLRKAQRTSQRDLAERVGIDFTYLSKLENGVMSLKQWGNKEPAHPGDPYLDIMFPSPVRVI